MVYACNTCSHTVTTDYNSNAYNKALKKTLEKTGKHEKNNPGHYMDPRPKLQN